MSRTKLIFLAMVIAVVGAVGFGAIWSYNYVEHDPRFCASCHLMNSAWETWKKGAHNQLDCHVCHQQNIQDRVRIVWSWATSNIKNVPPHTKLNRRVCEECHLNDKAKWPQISKTVGHDIHVGRNKLECLSCHLPSLHAVKPTTKECTTCHSKASTNIGGMKALHCTTCHKFAAKNNGQGLKPEKEVCLGCHSAMSFKGETFPEHGPMQYECSGCHKPHSQPLLKFNDCLGCHPTIAEDRWHFDQKALTQCVSCHKPHDWKAEKKATEKK